MKLQHDSSRTSAQAVGAPTQKATLRATPCRSCIQKVCSERKSESTPISAGILVGVKFLEWPRSLAGPRCSNTDALSGFADPLDDSTRDLVAAYLILGGATSGRRAGEHAEGLDHLQKTPGTHHVSHWIRAPGWRAC